jgi:hypothetical protein
MTMANDGRFSIEQRTTEPLMKAERPHEDKRVGWLNVVRDGGLWHMWYETFDHNYKDTRDSFLCYARSADGVHWERPALGLFEYAGSRDNNILIDGATIQGLHGHHVILDEDAPAAERFKMAFCSCRDCPKGTGWWACGAVSGDGLNWRMLPEPLLKHTSDTQQAIIREGGRFRLYLRDWTGAKAYEGRRVVSYSESASFDGFCPPRTILAPDEQDPQDLHFYNSAATKLRDDLYVMLPSAFYTADGTVRPHLAVSGDGVSFTRVGRTPLLEPGPGFDSQGLYVAPGAMPGPVADSWWFYYVGTATKHDRSVDSEIGYEGGFGRFLLVRRQ